MRDGNQKYDDYKVESVACPYYRLDDEYKIARKQ